MIIKTFYVIRLEKNTFLKKIKNCDDFLFLKIVFIKLCCKTNTERDRVRLVQLDLNKIHDFACCQK